MKNSLSNSLLQAQGMPRRAKQLVLVAVDAFMLPLLLWFCTALRLDQWQPLSMKSLEATWPLVALYVVIAAACRVYSAVIRVYNEHYLWSALVASVVWSTAVLLLNGTVWNAVPRSVILMVALLMFAHVWLSRWLIRTLVLGILNDSQPRRRVVIYGAGSAGRQLAAAMEGMADAELVAFVDDDKQLQARRLGAVPVWGSKQLKHQLSHSQVTEVIVAMPSVTRALRRDIVARVEAAAESYPVKILMLPGLDRIVRGEVALADVSSVDILDLLGRDPMPPDLSLFGHHVADRVVMVTGAAGSIGSELCRQILTAAPVALLLFDHSEYGLYAIERELREKYPKAKLVPVLGCTLDHPRLVRVMQSHAVETVYHAAAYKHVPLVEANPFEGVRNNSLGTFYAAMAARDAGVETFVLISTDKAVRPTNVMGASKRLAELALQALAAEPVSPKHLGTCYSMVRFGNVLGSSGSVVPLFRQQIQAGGPLTLTHADMTRYFMTIPEAAQLVIQAGGMAKGGEVFLLEMGEPVRIVDLARQMIHFSGLSERNPENPNGDIEIAYTGLRPGEKLYEELLISAEDVVKTSHPLIYKAHEAFMPLAAVEQLFSEIEALALTRDTLGLKRLLQQCVQGYVPDLTAQDVTSV